jgi:hypothetical protein
MNLPNVKHSLSWAQAYGFKWHIIHAAAARENISKARRVGGDVKWVYLSAARRDADRARHSLNFAMEN